MHVTTDANVCLQEFFQHYWQPAALLEVSLSGHTTQTNLQYMEVSSTDAAEVPSSKATCLRSIRRFPEGKITGGLNKIKLPV